MDMASPGAINLHLRMERGKLTTNFKIDFLSKKYFILERKENFTTVS